MFAFFNEHHFVACEDCGATMARAEREKHVCDEEKRLERELVRVVEAEVGGFEAELGDYLHSPEGRFQVWYAERQRRRAA